MKASSLVALLVSALTAYALPASGCGDSCDLAKNRCFDGEFCIAIPFVGKGETCNQFSANPAECQDGLKCIKNADPHKWYTCE
ncbi:hypothetical protein HDU81_009165 [Chytriomyces hyalinus]|nr:hypothetical protein HDU81_009165 [Chytriomyces hyalinus]